VRAGRFFNAATIQREIEREHGGEFYVDFDAETPRR
jgi:hypothetical protein